MSMTGHRVRRATVEDLERLKVLWDAMRFPPADLEKRITEFQVAVSGQGRLDGALAMEINGRNGRLHSEAFTDFALAETLRALLWERMQSVANNHGLARLWTQESAPFWKQQGFKQPDEAAMKRLPEGLDPNPAVWLTLQRWDEDTVEKSLEKEFVRFKQAEKRNTAKAMLPGRILNFAATVLAVMLGIFILGILIKVLKSATGR